MTHLLDVNVLIALVDGQHLTHDAAHLWFAQAGLWATCPLTQNAFVRVLCNPACPTVDATVSGVISTLRQLMTHDRHVFLPADVSLTDPSLVDASLVSGSRQITGVYLLALAHRHGMTLATFDRRLTAGAVGGGVWARLERIPALT